MKDPKGSSEDERAIRAVIAQMTEGFNRHDSKAATSMYTTDADLVTVTVEAVTPQGYVICTWADPNTRSLS